MGAPVYALDFDGVICDSVGESSISGYDAARRMWPGAMAGALDGGAGGGGAKGAAGGGMPGWLMEGMRGVRPIVETGYENVLLARMLAEEIGGRGRAGAAVVEEVVQRWGASLREELLERWKVGMGQLVEAFAGVRDEWLARDADSWVAANRFYPGVADMLNMTAGRVFVVTTKQARFVEVLLRANGVRGLGPDRIFGLGSGSKIQVLKSLLARPELKGKYIQFVEDRYETLEAVSLSMLGKPLKLYLAKWGYNTQEKRDRAEKHPLIETVDLANFTAQFQ